MILGLFEPSNFLTSNLAVRTAAIRAAMRRIVLGGHSWSATYISLFECRVTHGHQMAFEILPDFHSPPGSV